MKKRETKEQKNILNVKSIIERAWENVKADYEDAKECGREFEKDRKKRSAKDFAYLPWSELDVQFLFAKKVEELYAMSGTKAEIHHNWNVKNWYNISNKFRQLLNRTFPQGRRIDLYVSSPYSGLWGGRKAMFDVMLEFKMYREGKGAFYPWEGLKPQMDSLLQAKKIGMVKEIAVALINRGGLEEKKWKNLLHQASSRIKRGIILLEYDAGPLE